jgi:DNA-binding transcriptional MerR regulator
MAGVVQPGLFTLAEVGGLLGSAEVAEETGATYRQITYWAAQGYIHATHQDGTGTGSGYRHHFAATEVEVIRVMHALTRIGFNPGVAAPLARELVLTGQAHRGTLAMTWATD